MPVCGKQKCANAICITGVPVRGIGRIYRTATGLVLFILLYGRNDISDHHLLRGKVANAVAKAPTEANEAHTMGNTAHQNSHLPDPPVVAAS